MTTPPPTLTIWSNTPLPPEALDLLRRGTAPHRLIEAPAAANVFTAAPAGDSASELERSDVAFGQPDPEVLLRSPYLRWAHISSAGYTPFDRDDLRLALRARGAQLSNSSSVYAEPCAQHALAMMLADARQLLPAAREQAASRDWQSGHHRGNSYLLHDQHVLFLGFGAIGRRLAQLLSPFGVRVQALRRQPSGDEGVEVITLQGLPAALASCQLLVNLLPASAATAGFMNAERFALLPSGARFYNIGRGSTVDQDALCQALHSGRLAGAYLDVTDPEPLPPDHPLWSAPNCAITPHTAGGFVGEHLRLVQAFLNNLGRFTRAEPLADRVI